MSDGMEMSHVIRRQILELTVPDDREGRSLQERLRGINERRLLPAMDEIFSSVAGDDEVVRLGRVDLDLGTIPSGDLEDALIERIRTQLGEALRREVSFLREAALPSDRGRVVAAEQSRLELIQGFLEFGRVPWSTANVPGLDLEEIICELAERTPNAMADMLRAIMKPRVANRIVSQFSDVVVARLAALLAPGAGSLVDDATADWIHLLVDRADGGGAAELVAWTAGPEPARRLVQHWILLALAEESEPGAALAVTARGIVRELAATHAIESGQLVAALAALARVLLPSGSPVRAWLEETSGSASHRAAGLQTGGDDAERSAVSGSTTRRGAVAARQAVAGWSDDRAGPAARPDAGLSGKGEPPADGPVGQSEDSTRIKDLTSRSFPDAGGESGTARRGHDRIDEKEARGVAPIDHREERLAAASRRSIEAGGTPDAAPQGDERIDAHGHRAAAPARDGEKAAGGASPRRIEEGGENGAAMPSPGDGETDEGPRPPDRLPSAEPVGPQGEMASPREDMRDSREAGTKADTAERSDVPAPDGQGSVTTSHNRVAGDRSDGPSAGRSVAGGAADEDGIDATARQGADVPGEVPAASGTLPGIGERGLPAEDRRRTVADIPFDETPEGWRDEGRLDAAAGHYIDNAGLVLIWPFLTRYLGQLGLIEDKAFVSEDAGERAVLLLQHLVTGEEAWPEHRLLLNKLFCGRPPEETVPRRIELSEAEREESQDLLASVIEHWTALRNTSVDGLRASFLQREGRLTLQDQGWQLVIGRVGYDVLLDLIPWGIGLIKLPWMKEPLFVEW